MYSILDVSSKILKLVMSIPRSQAGEHQVLHFGVTLLNWAARLSYLTSSSDTSGVRRNASLDETSSEKRVYTGARSNSATSIIDERTPTLARRHDSCSFLNSVIIIVCRSGWTAACMSAKTPIDLVYLIDIVVRGRSMRLRTTCLR